MQDLDKRRQAVLSRLGGRNQLASQHVLIKSSGGHRGHTDVSLGQARHLRLPGGVSHYLRKLGSHGRIMSRDGHTQVSERPLWPWQGEGWEERGKEASRRSSCWSQKVLRSCLLMLPMGAGARVCQGAFLKMTSTELMTNCMWG